MACLHLVSILNSISYLKSFKDSVSLGCTALFVLFISIWRLKWRLFSRLVLSLVIEASL